MLKRLKKLSCFFASVLLLFPAQIFALFFVYFFTIITGLLIVGYIIGCVLFGFVASLPILKQISHAGISRAYQIILDLLVVLVMAGLLFLSMVSF